MANTTVTPIKLAIVISLKTPTATKTSAVNNYNILDAGNHA